MNILRELLNECDGIPLCLQRTGGICPSGREDIPEDVKGEKYAFRSYVMLHLIIFGPFSTCLQFRGFSLSW